jgi:hypothetical protein
LRPLLLLGLAVGAAPAWAAAPAPGATQPIELGGVEVFILPTVGPASGPETSMDVQIDVEARTDEAARVLGFKSLLGDTTIDCRTGANRFVTAQAYDQPDRQGPARSSHLSGQWVTPSSGSYMAEVTQRVCAGKAATASGPALVVTGQPSPPPPAEATSHAPPPVAAVAVQPIPAAAPAEAQPAAAPEAGPPPEAPARIVMPSATASRVATPPKPAQASSPAGASRPGNVVAQVAAVPDAHAAQKVLDKLRDLIAPPLTTKVEAATVQNVKLYRASVDGFATVADARAFCARAASISKTCWVRLRASSPSKPS